MIGSQLQAAIYTVLTGASVAGGRIYDRVPEGPTYPYVTIGDDQTINAGNVCEDGWTVYADVHVWSRPANESKGEVKGLVATIVPLLATELTVTGHLVVLGELETVRTFRDPDGLTEHSVITIRYEVEPAS